MDAAPAPKRLRAEQPPSPPASAEAAAMTASAPPPSALVCAWLPAAPTDTQRAFEVSPGPGVRSAADDSSAASAACCSATAGVELQYEWRITCEKKIPFCVKELTGQGRLAASADAPSAGATGVSVDLSRTGYGLMRLEVKAIGDDDTAAAEATTVREVVTELPEGRSMTRADPAGAAAGAESWVGEQAWRAATRLILTPDASPASSSGKEGEARGRPTITSSELAAHRSVGDGWLAVRGVVYDVSPFLQHHPGGVRTLLGLLGGDATEQFEAVHPQGKFTSNPRCCVWVAGVF